MKKLLCSICFVTLFIITVNGQTTVDTLVDAGNYNLHFTIIKGKGVPVLFEPGMGDSSAIWLPIANAVYNATGNTVIMYDRPGYGKTTANEQLNDSAYNVLNQTLALESALKKLGVLNNLILVCHSYGGFYSTLLTARNPQKIKHLIRLDASIASVYDDSFLKDFLQEPPDKSLGLGSYYEIVNFPASVRFMRAVELPIGIKLTEVVAGVHDAAEPPEETKKWETKHRDIVDAQPTMRQFLIAKSCGHHIMVDNPTLVINLILNSIR